MEFSENFVTSFSQPFFFEFICRVYKITALVVFFLGYRKQIRYFAKLYKFHVIIRTIFFNKFLTAFFIPISGFQLLKPIPIFTKIMIFTLFPKIVTHRIHG